MGSKESGDGDVDDVDEGYDCADLLDTLDVDKREIARLDGCSATCTVCETLKSQETLCLMQLPHSGCTSSH